MPLVDVELANSRSDLPADVAAFLQEADRRVAQFMGDRPIQIAGFVPSNYRTVYQALRAVADASLAPGAALCEWGSGFGVVACLASMLGYSVSGIEIDAELVDAARALAEEFDLPVEFIHGSFVPVGAEAFTVDAYVENSGGSFWLVTDSDHAYDELGLDPDDFDIVFAYPWPGEEPVIARLFERYAAEHALLLEFSQFNTVRLQRKVRGQSRR